MARTNYKGLSWVVLVHTWQSGTAFMTVPDNGMRTQAQAVTS